MYRGRHNSIIDTAGISHSLHSGQYEGIVYGAEDDISLLLDVFGAIPVYGFENGDFVCVGISVSGLFEKEDLLYELVDGRMRLSIPTILTTSRCL